MAVFLEVLAIWYFFRQGINWGTGGRLIVVTALITISFLSIRPNESKVTSPEGLYGYIGQGKPVLLEFKSPNWLGCVLAEPIVNGLEEDLSGELIVLRIDILEPVGQELKEEFGVRTTPTFVLLDELGEEAWRQIGTIDDGKVRSFVQK